MPIQIDITDGAVGSHHITQGWTITRVAIVWDIPTCPDTATLLKTAENTVIFYTGDRGTPCPNIDVPTFLDHFEHKIISANVVEVRIIYKGHPKPVYEFDTCLNQVESNLDIDSKAVELSYTYPSDYTLDPFKAGKTLPGTGKYSRQVSETSATVHVLVTAHDGQTATQNMSDLMDYNNTMNDATYHIGNLVGDAHFWKCTRVRGVSHDGGLSYEASMTFQLRESPDGWDEEFLFINPDDGLPPPDVMDQSDAHSLRSVLYEASFPTFAFENN